MDKNDVCMLYSINDDYLYRHFTSFWILIILIFSPLNLKADCLACWKLKYVEIENNQGDVSKGYMIWSDLWVKSSQSLHQKDYSQATEFCDTIATYFADNSNKLILSKDIVFNRKLFGSAAIAVGKADTINIDEIRNILTPHSEYNGLDGAGFMPRISKYQSELLKSDSLVAMYKTAGWEFSDAYFLSYDANIREEELKNIAKNRDETSKFDGNIILIEIHYD